MIVCAVVVFVVAFLAAASVLNSWAIRKYQESVEEFEEVRKALL